MINNQGSESKHNATIALDGATGVKSSEFPVFVESRVRFQCEGVGGTNVVACEGRIKGATLWTSLATCTGLASAVADVSTYDYIRFNVTTSDGSGGYCISSGFIAMF
jgi:hypothetical protein